MSDEHPRTARKARANSRSDKQAPQGEARLDRPRATEELKRFLDLIRSEAHLEIEYEIRPRAEGEDPSQTPELAVVLSGPDQDLLLERHAELLLALEHLAHRWLRLEPRLHDQVRFDCGDYRSTRIEELKLSARVAAQRVRETGQPFPFQPMSSRERRLIHLELTGAPGVRTESEGWGDRRHLVIYPANKK